MTPWLPSPRRCGRPALSSSPAHICFETRSPCPEGQGPGATACDPRKGTRTPEHPSQPGSMTPARKPQGGSSVRPLSPGALSSWLPLPSPGFAPCCRAGPCPSGPATNSVFTASSQASVRGQCPDPPGPPSPGRLLAHLGSLHPHDGPWAHSRPRGRCSARPRTGRCLSPPGGRVNYASESIHLMNSYGAGEAASNGWGFRGARVPRPLF